MPCRCFFLKKNAGNINILHFVIVIYSYDIKLVTDKTTTKLKLLDQVHLNGYMLLVRIIENNKIDAYFRSG